MPCTTWGEVGSLQLHRIHRTQPAACLTAHMRSMTFYIKVRSDQIGMQGAHLSSCSLLLLVGAPLLIPAVLVKEGAVSPRVVLGPDVHVGVLGPVVLMLVSL